MSYYDDIYEYAADNFGLITSAYAREIGIPGIELVKLAHRGRIERVGWGVYKIKQYIPTPLDRYAEAVAITGHGAYIFGESVLAMHNLALVNPSKITVATTEKHRRTLPAYIKSIQRSGDEILYYEGIPYQSVACAIEVCKWRVLPERLLDAIGDATGEGLVTKKDARRLRKEILNAK